MTHINPGQFTKRIACTTLFMLGSCASGEDGTTALLPEAGVVPHTADASLVPVASASVCAATEEGSQRPCTCPEGTQGMQSCSNGFFQACKCAPKIVTAQMLCKAGFYSGQFTGKYKPGAFGFGIIESFVEVDIMGAGSNGYPALSLTLEAMHSGDSEFATFTVKNGCMIGSANAYGTNNPFVALISGELDCETGRFSGEITGHYDLLGFGLTFDFTGPVESQFEAPQYRLKDGTWNVKEPPALDGTAAGGGGGTWSALWESDKPPVGANPCSTSALVDAGT